MRLPARLLVLGLGLLGPGLLAACPRAVPDGPEPVAWSRETCARCRMLIGEPRFTAQLQTAAGAVLNFDDPGCLLLFQEQERPTVRAAWFHHHAEERWIPEARVGFVPVREPTPMGYGLGVVEREASPEALSADQALARVREREEARRER